MAGCCVFLHSWKDTAHWVYDIPAGLAAFGFIAQTLLEVIETRLDWYWGGRMLLVAGMAVVCTGREYFGWNISGHLSCILAVALAQAADPRLATAERLLYWIPLPIVLGPRWCLLDHGQHWQTYNAAALGILAAIPVVILARLTLRGRI
jgi:hypothetical protein